ncbi:hypothetical protein QS587_24745, partial [Escherichia coli]|nr:hypothetical protein [Escherichia coli]
GTADRNRSHWSTSKTPSYTKSVSWQHHQQISENTKIISQKIRTGSYFRDVLEEVIDDLKTR